jgi:hypothetical protein
MLNRIRRVKMRKITATPPFPIPSAYKCPRSIYCDRARLEPGDPRRPLVTHAPENRSNLVGPPSTSLARSSRSEQPTVAKSARHLRPPADRMRTDFFDHRLRNETELEEKSDYIQMNPLRRSLCKEAED